MKSHKHKWKVILEDYYVSHAYTMNIKDCVAVVLNLYYKEAFVCTVMYRNDGYSKIMSEVLQIHVKRIKYILDSIAMFVCQTFGYVGRLPLVRYYTDNTASAVCCAFAQLLFEFQYLYDVSGDVSENGLLFNWNNKSLLSNGSHMDSDGWLFVPSDSDIHAMQCSMFAVYALPVKAKKYTVKLQLIDIKRGIVQAFYLNTAQKCS